MAQEKSDNLNSRIADNENCSVCTALIENLEQFFQMLETARRYPTSHWLTVEEIAKELKVSKSIVYRLIRNGELEAVDIVETNGQIRQKGHYRIERSSLNQYLESKKVRPSPNRSNRPQSRRFPKVKNHLGL